MKRRLITVADLVLLVAVVAVTVVLFIGFDLPDRGKVAVVTVDNKEVIRLELAVDAKECIKMAEGYNIILVSDGKCSVIEADCRDGICENRGEIFKKGESIVCLPHKMIVEIK